MSSFQGKKIVGATCSAENAKSYVFKDGLIDPHTNTIVYKCFCERSLKGRDLVCVMHYWICPFTG